MAVNPYTYSTTPASNTSLNGATMAEGMNPGSVNDGVRQFAADFAALVKDLAGGVVAGGTANAITVTANSAFAAYANGLFVAFKASADNTAATTLNVNSIGAKSVRKMTTSGDAALEGGEIQDDGIYIVQYSEDANSAAGGWILVNPTTLGASVASLTISGTAPAITLTDTDTGADCLVSGSSTSGDLTLSADHNNEVSGSAITMAVDGSVKATVGPSGFPVAKASGDLSTAGVSLFSSGLGQFTRANDYVAQFNRLSSNGGLVEFLVGSVNKGSISTDGSTTSYNTTSDKRLKENLREFDSGAIIDKLKVWEFDWKATGNVGHGVLAQDAYEVYPEAIYVPGEEAHPWQADYSKFIPLLLQEVQNLRREVAALKARKD